MVYKRQAARVAAASVILLASPAMLDWLTASRSLFSWPSGEQALHKNSTFPLRTVRRPSNRLTQFLPQRWQFIVYSTWCNYKASASAPLKGMSLVSTDGGRRLSTSAVLARLVRRKRYRRKADNESAAPIDRNGGVR
jgi:hypothetical protein